MGPFLERVRTVWDNLSARERMLVGIAGGTLTVALLYFAIVMPLLSVVDGAGSQSGAAEQQLQAMQRLRREYDGFASRLGTVEARIRNSRNRQNLLTLLESLANDSGVKIQSVQERQASKHDEYRETKVEVDLKNVTLTQTVSYLHNIESADRQLSVKGLRIRTRPDKSGLLDVNFTVSAFEPLAS